MTEQDEHDWLHGEIALVHPEATDDELELMVALGMAEKRLADLTEAWNALPDARGR